MEASVVVCLPLRLRSLKFHKAECERQHAVYMFPPWYDSGEGAMPPCLGAPNCSWSTGWLWGGHMWVDNGGPVWAVVSLRVVDCYMGLF